MPQVVRLSSISLEAMQFGLSTPIHGAVYVAPQRSYTMQLCSSKWHSQEALSVANQRFWKQPSALTLPQAFCNASGLSDLQQRGAPVVVALMTDSASIGTTQSLSLFQVAGGQILPERLVMSRFWQGAQQVLNGFRHMRDALLWVGYAHTTTDSAILKMMSDLQTQLPGFGLLSPLAFKGATGTRHPAISMYAARQIDDALQQRGMSISLELEAVPHGDDRMIRKAQQSAQLPSSGLQAFAHRIRVPIEGVHIVPVSVTLWLESNTYMQPIDIQMQLRRCQQLQQQVRCPPKL